MPREPLLLRRRTALIVLGALFCADARAVSHKVLLAQRKKKVQEIEESDVVVYSSSEFRISATMAR